MTTHATLEKADQIIEKTDADGARDLAKCFSRETTIAIFKTFPDDVNEGAFEYFEDKKAWMELIETFQDPKRARRLISEAFLWYYFYRPIHKALCAMMEEAKPCDTSES